ncbi:MAG: hypothetical protein U5K51_13115 [Flavobacteriaceae bacterium]|nr:hypothetical protein [Flavobacteriaceae bacterium]
MSKLKQLFDFYIQANFHVALSAFCLTRITQIEFGSAGLYTGIFVFTSTFAAYNLIRFWKRNKLPVSDADWLKSHKGSLLLLNILAGFSIFYFGASLRNESLVLLIPLFFATLFYSMPYQFGRKSLQLRNIPGMKIFLIAVVWSSVTVLVPLAEIQSDMQGDQWISFAQRFLFIFALAIPFDIRDMNLDQRTLQTIPQRLGIRNSKILGIVLLVFFFILDFFKDGQIIFATLPLFLTTLISMIFLLYSNGQKGKYYTTFWVESIPVFWFIMIRLILI